MMTKPHKFNWQKERKILTSLTAETNGCIQTQMKNKTEVKYVEK